MESYEVIARAIDKVGAKKVAHDVRVSTSLVYKWSQKPKDDARDSSGARNPLDRVQGLIESTKDSGILEWLCQKSGGFLVHNPEAEPETVDENYVNQTQQIIQEFSEVLGVVSTSMTDDGKVDEAEAKRIRQGWQKLKQIGEAFVLACERGYYDHTRSEENDQG